MRFRFRFERILRLVELNERKKKLEVANKIQKISQLESRLEELGKMTANLLDAQYREQSLERVPYRIAKVEMNQAETGALGGVLLNERESLEELKFELQKHYRKRKALELMREKGKREYSRIEGRKAQKFLDEISGNPFRKTSP